MCAKSRTSASRLRGETGRPRLALSASSAAYRTSAHRSRSAAVASRYVSSALVTKRSCRRDRFGRCDALQLREHQAVEVAVKHVVGRARLVARAVVLDHLIRVEYVRADLVAPARLDVLAAQERELALALLETPFEQPRAEHFHRELAVLVLRPLVLALRDDAGWDMREAHCGVCLVDVLAARTLRAEGVDLELVLRDLADFRVVLDLWQDLDQRERGVAPFLRVVRRDAHESMHAALRPEVAVGGPALDTDRGALEAR